MAIEHGRLRAEILGYLRVHPKGRVNLDWNGEHSLLNYFHHSRRIELSRDDQTTIVGIFHDLYRECILDTGLGPDYVDQVLSWPHYRLTIYGKKVVESGEYTPFDPDGYLAKLRRDVPEVHADVIRFLDESLGCLRANYLLAASVMLGCAAEKCLLELVEVYGDSITDPGKKAEYERDTRSWMISRKYDALWKRLEPQAPSLPRHLGDDLHVILDRVFDLIRTTRNDAGHPTGKVVERETVLANLILFPSYCRRVYGLIGHLTPG